MQFRLNTKLFSLVSNYQIRTANNDVVYEVRGKFFSFGNDLTIDNADGIEVARIRQRLLNFMPTYDLFIGDKPFGTISREFSWFKKSFFLDVPGPNDYQIEGNFWNYEYEFRRGGRVVATVSRSMFSLTSEYGVDIEKGEDELSILATVVVVDLCNRRESGDA